MAQQSCKKLLNTKSPSGIKVHEDKIFIILILLCVLYGFLVPLCLKIFFVKKTKVTTQVQGLKVPGSRFKMNEN
jgi:hypothetical protein